MNNKPYSQILDAAAGDLIPQDLDLAPIILARIQKGKGIHMQTRTKLVSAILLVVLMFVVLFYTVPGMAAAIRHWFGYVPGVGLIHEGQIRVLEKPVIITREGVTTTVEQVVLDPERSTLLYSVEDIPDTAFTTSPSERCQYSTALLLPDGRLLSPGPGGGQVWQNGYQHRFEYPPIPTEINDVRLVISCLFTTRPGSAPENWEIPLHFIPAPPEMTAFPVIEISTPTLPAVTATPSVSAARIIPAATTMTLTLDRAVQMDDGYLIYATLHWMDTPFQAVDITDLTQTLHLLDANGQEMLYEMRQDEQTGVKSEQRQRTFTIKTAPVQITGPLTLVLDAVSVDVPVDASFRFDPGANPKPGQKWELVQEVKIGEYSLNVQSVTASESGYTFDMTSDTGILRAMLSDLDHPIPSGGGGGGGSDQRSPFTYSISYANGLPDGPVTVTVTSIGIQYTQRLQAQWTPPSASPRLLPTQAAACLTSEVWKTALSQKPALPDTLSGKILVYGPVDNKKVNGAWGLILTHLDSSTRDVITGASDGAFSPDGKKLAYSIHDTGISILDLASNQSTFLQHTGNGDFNPFWSPDGKQIVFNRGMGIFDLFIMDADGSNMRQLTHGGAQEWPVAWLSSGQSLLYGLPGRDDEFIIYRLDLQSGKSEVYTGVTPQTVSPDGKSIITSENVFSDRWQVWISAPDGSNRWLLTDSSLSVVTSIWSPDGEWLLAGVLETDSGPAVGALINLRNCQVIPLPEMQGSFLSWVP